MMYKLCVCVCCSGQKIQSSVERMFRIWRERKVYDKIFVRRLDTLLSSGKSGQEEGWRTLFLSFSLSPGSVK